MSEIWDLDVTDANNNDASFGFPESMNPSDVNDNLRRILGALARWYGDTNGTLVTAGTGSAYTIAAPNRSLTTSYSDGLVIAFQAHTVCASGATLAVDGKTAKTLMKQAGITISASDIIQDQIVLAAYESGIDAWQMLSPISGVGAAPYPTGGSTPETIATTTISSDAYATFSSLGSTFYIHEFEFINIVPATDNTVLRCEIETGGSTWQTANYRNHISYPNHAAATYAGAGNAATAYFELAPGLGTASGETLSGTLRIYTVNDSSYRKIVRWKMGMQDQGSQALHITSHGFWNGANTAITGIRFFMSSGNLASGTIIHKGLLRI